MIRSRTFRAGSPRKAGASPAFSLLELLMVFSIIMVLTALILPAVKSARDMSKKAVCATNMRQIGMAFRMYQSDHRGLYPNPWVDNSHNWQGYLCDALTVSSTGVGTFGPNQYLSQSVLGFCNDASGTDSNGNIGTGNSGSNNVGNNNSGNNNIGNNNSGNDNQGNSNSGNNNIGNNNSGSYNNGNHNSGSYNSGSNQSGSGTPGSTGVIGGNPPPNPYAARFLGPIDCPKVCQLYNISLTGPQKQWGYTYNYTRVGISYGASGSPWNESQYANGDLDWIYPKSGLCAVMTCGNGPSFNSDLDWNAFTASDPTDWAVIPIHNNTVNVLFMDGHVQSMTVNTTAGKSDFNSAWYTGIPSTLANPW